MVEVTPADRRLVADILESAGSDVDHAGLIATADLIRAGRYDDYPTVQIAATHRIEAVKAERDRLASLFAVFNIGCIECGVSSQLVGVFATEAEADAIANDFDEKFSWREGGQNHFQVFPLPSKVGVIHEEYLADALEIQP